MRCQLLHTGHVKFLHWDLEMHSSRISSGASCLLTCLASASPPVKQQSWKSNAKDPFHLLHMDTFPEPENCSNNTTQMNDVIIISHASCTVLDLAALVTSAHLTSSSARPNINLLKGILADGICGRDELMPEEINYLWRMVP
ncbi:hypothetical protein H920_18029 [Fukomys damarensis]|uniref:Uncharacterized protein n=1 Tax=Fukomys damarensis TaxID=885580 RepID=A0A091CNM4_FUKDA|nr:hypothetical protein H920_18029 [Fukomys damarensis]